MSASRQIRDNLEEAAESILQYVEMNREGLKKDVELLSKQYKTPLETWGLGFIRAYFRSRSPQIDILQKKVAEGEDIDVIYVLKNFFQTGSWQANSANTNFMRILITKIEKDCKYDHHPLEIEMIQRLNTLLLGKITVRIKESLHADVERKERQREVNKMQNSFKPIVGEIKKYYIAPERHQFDFEHDEGLKTLTKSLATIWTKAVTPTERRIEPLSTKVDLSGAKEKISHTLVVPNAPENNEDDLKSLQSSSDWSSDMTEREIDTEDDEIFFEFDTEVEEEAYPEVESDEIYNLESLFSPDSDTEMEEIAEENIPVSDISLTVEATSNEQESKEQERKEQERKERYDSAAKNINALFGATLRRRAQMETENKVVAGAKLR